MIKKQKNYCAFSVRQALTLIVGVLQRFSELFAVAAAILLSTAALKLPTDAAISVRSDADTVRFINTDLVLPRVLIPPDWFVRTAWCSTAVYRTDYLISADFHWIQIY